MRMAAAARCIRIQPDMAGAAVQTRAHIRLAMTLGRRDEHSGRDRRAYAGVLANRFGRVRTMRVAAVLLLVASAVGSGLDTKQAGEVLVDSLLGLIRGEPGYSEVLPVKLVVRRSSLR
jgi:hypothetical protein